MSIQSDQSTYMTAVSNGTNHASHGSAASYTSAGSVHTAEPPTFAENYAYPAPPGFVTTATGAQFWQ